MCAVVRRKGGSEWRHGEPLLFDLVHRGMATGRLQFVEDVVHVVLDRRDFNLEPRGYFLITQTRFYQLYDLHSTSGEARSIVPPSFFAPARELCHASPAEQLQASAALSS